jgi:hypothetical protein
MSYATQTSVSVEKTRAEIEAMITKFGASRFMSGTEPGMALIGFEVRGKLVRFVLPLPDKQEQRFWRTPHRRHTRTADEAYREWEQACRSSWRALGLCIKAKLEAVEQKITTFETEFLAHFVLPNGQTMGEYSIPMLDQMTKDGQMPRLMLGSESEQGPSIIDLKANQ